MRDRGGARSQQVNLDDRSTGGVSGNVLDGDGGQLHLPASALPMKVESSVAYVIRLQAGSRRSR